MEKKVEVMKYEESKKHCGTLEAKVESLTQSLDQAVQQGRSNNVLELEMKNYEVGVSEYFFMKIIKSELKKNNKSAFIYPILFDQDRLFQCFMC